MRVRSWFTAAAVLAAFTATDAFAAEKSSLVGRAAPTFQLPLVSQGGQAAQGKTWALTAAPGRPTVLMFVSVQCPVSNAYNARMAEVAKDYAAKGVTFVGINPNKSESTEAIARHAKESGFTFPVVKDHGNKVADLYNAQVTPEVYVIDAKGVLRYQGRIDNSRNLASVKTQELRAALDDVLAGRAVRTASTQAFGCSIKRVAAE